MAHYVLTDAKIWLAGFDLSGDMNAVGIQYAAEAVDDTHFGDDTEINLGGRTNWNVDASGSVNAASGGSDPVLFDRIQSASDPLSVSPDGGEEGDRAYVMLPLNTQYVPGGAHGERHAFDFAATGAEHLVRGTVMQNDTETSTGTGTARQLGNVAAGEKLYAALHVLSASGTSPTLDVTVKSDDASGFASPTTRITFSTASGVTSEWATPVSGAITDDWWRIDWTIGGTGSPSFEFVVVVGII